MQPYSAFNNNPIYFNDPTGMIAESPIYGTDGTFLGTDDQGLQGKAIVMDAENFTQGMSHSDALDKGKTAEEFSHDIGSHDYTVMGTVSDTDAEAAMNADLAVLDKVESHHAELPNRADYDGILTLSEANEWYRGNSGEPLFVDAAKINLSPVKVGDFKDGVGSSKHKNYLSTSGNASTGLVYGTIKLTLVNSNGSVKLGNTSTGKLDTYNFDQQKGRTARNIATWIGSKVAGKGTAFDIYNYGTGKVKKD